MEANKYQSIRQMLPVQNSAISIKCKCGGEVRRVTIHNVPTFDELLFLVHRLFRSRLPANLNNIVLKYIDEDNDLVSITDDIDINHAMAISNTIKILVYDHEKNPFPELPAQLSNFYSNNNKINTLDFLEVRQEIRDINNKLDQLFHSLKKDVKSENNTKHDNTLSNSDMDQLLEGTNALKLGNASNNTSGGPNTNSQEASSLSKPQTSYPPIPQQSTYSDSPQISSNIQNSTPASTNQQSQYPLNQQQSAQHQPAQHQQNSYPPVQQSIPLNQVSIGQNQSPYPSSGQLPPKQGYGQGSYYPSSHQSTPQSNPQASAPYPPQNSLPQQHHQSSYPPISNNSTASAQYGHTSYPPTPSHVSGYPPQSSGYPSQVPPSPGVYPNPYRN
ncbi:hypothetical protein K502DRAFT_35555 [Neoconidiobolus thromboides FSU 785]|nr:hypothetical protein K502DRAFT_35555 [Neoconidiobolus thromboides FSU 785]